MKSYRQPAEGFGVSWGVAGLRIGRSQYGTWWISIGLPFGIRVTKRLGRMRDPLGGDTVAPSSADIAGQFSRAGSGEGQAQWSGARTKNQEVLERMKRGD
jgi:hypothetical protein